MVTTEAASVGAVVRSLERLSADFASAILPLERHEAGRFVEGMLKQVGEALAADQTFFESFTDDGALSRAPRAWTRPGACIIREPSTTLNVVAAGRRFGALSIVSTGEGEVWPPAIADQLQVIAGLIALADRCGDRAGAVARSDSDYARVEAASKSKDGEDLDNGEFEDIIGDSAALRVPLRRVLEVAPTDASVVLLGETGTGKELFARAVHNRSRRRCRPFIRVNCAALPPTLIESELFGHERGAFTGAVAARRGRFELAHTGTLFLDEIGDLPADVQSKLLRVLQEGEFERVGSSESRKVDVRIVAATHHDLVDAVKTGRFRQDLFYRLNVYPIALPPLRERAEDIPRLVWFFINQRQRALNRRFSIISPQVFATLQRHSWPGNVRELENVVERAMIHSTGAELSLDDGPGLAAGSAVGDDGTLENVERQHIESVLRRCRWRVNGPGNAAEVLGLHPNTLRFRMKKLGVHRPKELGIVVEVARLSA